MRKVNQSAVDASFGLVKDNKRRVVYYDEKLQQAFQINQKDHRWIKSNHLAFFFGIMAFYLIWFLLMNVVGQYRTIVGYLIGTAVYLLVKFLFKKRFIDQKPLAKVDSGVLSQINHPDTIKEKMNFNRYKISFVVLYGILIGIEVMQDNMDLWVKIVSFAIVLALAIFFIKKEFDYRKLIKEANKN